MGCVVDYIAKKQSTYSNHQARTRPSVHVRLYRMTQKSEEEEDKIVLTFNTSRFDVKLAEGTFATCTTVGEVHARLRRKLLKSISDKVGPPPMTYVFLKNGMEAFIPPPHLTLGELYNLYAVSRDTRSLSFTIDSEVFSG